MCAAIGMRQASGSRHKALIGGLLTVFSFGVFRVGRQHWGGAPAASGGAWNGRPCRELCGGIRVAMPAHGYGNWNGWPIGALTRFCSALAVRETWECGSFAARTRRLLQVVIHRIFSPLCVFACLDGRDTGYSLSRERGRTVRMTIQGEPGHVLDGRYFYWQKQHPVSRVSTIKSCRVLCK